jgi:hypothetical protein
VPAVESEKTPNARSELDTASHTKKHRFQIRCSRLGVLGALGVMRALPHAKIAKDAKGCNEKNNGF